MNSRPSSFEQAHVVHGLDQHVVRNVLLEQHVRRNDGLVLALHELQEVRKPRVVVFAVFLRQRAQHARTAIRDLDAVLPHDHFELKALVQFRHRGVGRRKIELENVRVGEHRREQQEEHEDHHHVDHRHDVEIVATLVLRMVANRAGGKFG